ncbi:flagellar motor protein MotB [Sandaracinobacteroides saxicola]|uniref:OmpA family protein n=1 Tax=Sandaracinobacteroides saxicola TaxID=2759707 RepID=A0A7G5IK12_9SPHN|nr:flagellar motor protein MotB [Sandaracinobacteroides saxicola]QMW23704.1 OmpA family protein [Sandaracinobacteroides saxicola]
MTEITTLPVPRPIIIKRRKIIAGSHHGGAWKVAYADFVTAMMAFFLLLWLLSSPDKARLKGIARYFSPMPPAADAGTGTGSDLVSAVRNAAEVRPGRAPREPAAAVNVRSIANDLRMALRASPITMGIDDNLRIAADPRGTRIELMDTRARPLFRLGTAEPNAYGLLVIKAIGERLGARGARIAIEGHSDGVGGLTDPNWRLSMDRANVARRLLTDAGVAAGRVSEVVAFANTRLAFPDDPARPENRRISVIVLDEDDAMPVMKPSA